jgi:hypothetical protein
MEGPPQVFLLELEDLVGLRLLLAGVPRGGCHPEQKKKNNNNKTNQQ